MAYKIKQCHLLTSNFWIVVYIYFFVSQYWESWCMSLISLKMRNIQCKNINWISNFFPPFDFVMQYWLSQYWNKSQRMVHVLHLSYIALLDWKTFGIGNDKDEKNINFSFCTWGQFAVLDKTMLFKDANTSWVPYGIMGESKRGVLVCWLCPFRITERFTDWQVLQWSVWPPLALHTSA